MAHHHELKVPRSVLVGVAALLVFTIVFVALARQGLVGRADLPPDAPVAARDLVFLDRSDGGVAVLAAATGETVEVLAPGTNGFLRGVLRGLARERRQHGLGMEQPFRLLKQGDGRLTLHDLATGRRIELISFGVTNAKAFARFLNDQESSS
ncbi:MAG: photosynthetic complex assembly protein PuhC [Kiloniellales bacterium]|nr:photosynthetic complex assembly protein PuhC [Kiloniellales bacterium]